MKSTDKLKNLVSNVSRNGNGSESMVAELPSKTQQQHTETSADDIATRANLNLKNRREQKEVNPFPIDAFPKRVRDIMCCFQDCDGYPIEYYFTNTLVVTASLLGVAYKARYRRGHEHYPILYAALVGNSSAGKGRSMRGVMSAVFKIEKKFKDDYIAACETWSNECFEAKMTDKKAPIPPEPIQREIVMDNFTLESLIRTMYRNPRGLMLTQEELLAWLKSMNAYRSGSDEQFWLKNWDAAFVKITRSSSETMTIENPNASVVGGIQPALLHELLSDGKGDSGFSARILFAYPDETNAPHDNDKFPDQSVYDNWYNIVKWIHDLPDRIALPATINQKPIVEDAVTIDCSDEAKTIYRAFFNKLADKINDSDDDRIKSMLGKMQAYCMRFALIIEVLNRASLHADYVAPEYPEDFDTKKWDTPSVVPKKYTADVGEKAWEVVQKDIKITEQSMHAAKALTEYYIETGKKVLQRLETPIESLRPEQKAWYEALPPGEAFRYITAKESAQKVKLSEATFKRLLNRQDLFTRRKGSLHTATGVKEIEMYMRKWF